MDLNDDPRDKLRAAIVEALTFNAEQRNPARHSLAWWVAARLKLVDEFIDLEEQTAADLVAALMGTEVWSNPDFWGDEIRTHDVRASFMRAWNQVELPGGSLFAWPTRQADAVEVLPLKAHTEGYRRFL